MLRDARTQTPAQSSNKAEYVARYAQECPGMYLHLVELGVNLLQFHREHLSMTTT